MCHCFWWRAVAKQINIGFASFRLSFEKQTNSFFESSVFDSVFRETIYFILLNLSGSVSAGEHTYSDSSVSTIIYGALKTVCPSDSTNCTCLLYCGGFLWWSVFWYMNNNVSWYELFLFIVIYYTTFPLLRMEQLPPTCNRAESVRFTRGRGFRFSVKILWRNK